MSDAVARLRTASEIQEIDAADLTDFDNDVRGLGAPAVLRGLVKAWPLVAAANDGDAAVVGYLSQRYNGQGITGIIGDTVGNRRLFYNDDVTRFNFERVSGRLDSFLRQLLQENKQSEVFAMALQSTLIDEILPTVAAENALALLPGIRPRIWIGNRIEVAPHYDLKENIACCAAGRRRFTLFPPDQLANLYPGPLELTPAGTPVSMVDPKNPDLARYPRFAEAWAAASQATLEPGDALYIPFGWWHGVDSLEPISILVNYWWTAARTDDVGNGYDAMLHALMSYRHLPPEQREIWRNMLDFYVFEQAGDPVSHLPSHAKGVLGPPSAKLFAMMRATLKRALG